MKKLEEIEFIIANEEDGVFAISLVENPAIQEKFVALSEHKIELKVLDEEKRIVVGLALIPEQRIYRRVGEKEFYGYFSAQTISQTAELYMKRLHLNNVTTEHKNQIQGATVIESWIVEDVKHDKSNIYKLNAVEGAWVVKMKIYNDEEWARIKEGKYQGFSIEGLFDAKPNEMTEAERAIEYIKSVLDGRP